MNVRILNQTETRISHERILKVQGNHVTHLFKVHRQQNHPYKNQNLKRKNKKLSDVKKLIEAGAFIDTVTGGLQWMVSPLIPIQVALVKSSGGPKTKNKGRDHNVEWRN